MADTFTDIKNDLFLQLKLVLRTDLLVIMCTEAQLAYLCDLMSYILFSCVILLNWDLKILIQGKILSRIRFKVMP